MGSLRKCELSIFLIHLVLFRQIVHLFSFIITHKAAQIHLGLFDSSVWLFAEHVASLNSCLLLLLLRLLTLLFAASVSHCIFFFLVCGCVVAVVIFRLSLRPSAPSALA